MRFRLLYDLLFTHIDSRFGYKLRRWLLSSQFGSCGQRLSIGIRATIRGIGNISLGDNASFFHDVKICASEGGRLTIGDNIAVNSNAYIDASPGSEIVIGNNVMIAQNTVMRACNHAHSRIDIPMRHQGHEVGGKIVIGDDVWICANAVITSGVTVNSHAIVAAGAVVTKDVGEYDVVGGVPARVLYNRKDKHVE